MTDVRSLCLENKSNIGPLVIIKLDEVSLQVSTCILVTLYPTINTEVEDFLKIMWEQEKMLVTSIFSCSHTVYLCPFNGQIPGNFSI